MGTEIAPIIQAVDLVKRFNGLTAVDGIIFAVYPGECFDFLGPNGGGKTTITRLICCASLVSQGTFIIDGYRVERDARAIKGLLGVVPQEETLGPNLTVYQNLVVYTGYFGILRSVAKARVEEALDLFQLWRRQVV